MFDTVLKLFLVLIWVCLIIADGTCSNEDCETGVLFDYVIVGGGSAGLQTALFMEKFNLNYIVLEKGSEVGVFWKQHPVMGELISINKWVRNETLRERYDWHSLLEAPLNLSAITDDYFPARADFQHYLKRVAQDAALNVLYEARVTSIESRQDVVTGQTQSGACVIVSSEKHDVPSRICARRRLFIGTGLRERDESIREALGGVRYSRFKPQMARHKRVCIAGNGNSGFEVAQASFGLAERVTIYGNGPVRLSAVTRYTGDVRIKFAQVIENFNGKLLDTAAFHEGGMKIRSKSMTQQQLETYRRLLQDTIHLRGYKCELWVLATGFESYVPGSNLTRRFPPTNDWYADKVLTDVHYIGWLMHERDFRRGAGGFVSGFRYLIRNLMHHVMQEDHDVAYPSLVLSSDEAVAHSVARIQTASDLLIMQDGDVLRDVLEPLNAERTQWRYYEGVNFKFHPHLHSRSDLVYLYFRWGDGRRAIHVFDMLYRFSDSDTLINLFLHPTIETDGVIRGILEDLAHAWDTPAHETAISKVVRAAMAHDLTQFKKRVEYKYEPAVFNQTEPPYFEVPDHGVAQPDADLFRAIHTALMNGTSAEHLDAVRAHAQRFLPHLFSNQHQ
mmetsp:Transcript_20236/g.34564  ORF Transcript_20236/g.34564 Transcript_20236/m.34564 type:complete len:617 (-) Transcript_20236:25-1875(-)